MANEKMSTIRVYQPHTKLESPGLLENGISDLPVTRPLGVLSAGQFHRLGHRLLLAGCLALVLVGGGL